MLVPALYFKRVTKYFPALLKKYEGQKKDSGPLVHRYVYKEMNASGEWDYIYPEDLQRMEREKGPELDKFQRSKNYKSNMRRIQKLQEEQKQNPAKYEENKLLASTQRAEEPPPKISPATLKAKKLEYGMDPDATATWFVDTETGEIRPVMREHEDVPADRRGIQILPGDIIKYDQTKAAHYTKAEKGEDGNFKNPAGKAKSTEGIFMGQSEDDPNMAVVAVHSGNRNGKYLVPMSSIKHHLTHPEKHAEKQKEVQATAAYKKNLKESLWKKEYGSPGMSVKEIDALFLAQPEISGGERTTTDPETGETKTVKIQGIIPKLENRLKKIFYLSDFAKNELTGYLQDFCTDSSKTQLVRLASQRESEGYVDEETGETVEGTGAPAAGISNRVMTRRAKGIIDHLNNTQTHALAGWCKEVIAGKFGMSEFTGDDMHNTIRYMKVLQELQAKNVGDVTKLPMKAKAEGLKQSMIDRFHGTIAKHTRTLDNAFTDIGTNYDPEVKAAAKEKLNGYIAKAKVAIENLDKKPISYFEDLVTTYDRYVSFKQLSDINSAEGVGDRNIEVSNSMYEGASGRDTRNKKALEHFQKYLPKIKTLLQGTGMTEAQVQRLVDYHTSLDTGQTEYEPWQGSDAEAALTKIGKEHPETMDTLNELIAQGLNLAADKDKDLYGEDFEDEDEYDSDFDPADNTSSY